jgi:hypothetical protein
VAFFDLKEVLCEHKAPMLIHAVALDEALETIYGAGHNKLAVMEMKG